MTLTIDTSSAHDVTLLQAIYNALFASTPAPSVRVAPIIVTAPAAEQPVAPVVSEQPASAAKAVKPKAAAPAAVEPAAPAATVEPAAPAAVEAPKAVATTAPSVEKLRELTSEKSKEGKTTEIKALLKEFGAANVSALDKANYSAYYEKVSAL